MRSEAAAGRLDEKMSADGGRSKGQTASGKDDTHTHTRPVPARHIGSLPGNHSETIRRLPNTVERGGIPGAARALRLLWALQSSRAGRKGLCAPILMVACLLMTNGCSGCSSAALSVARSCLLKYERPPEAEEAASLEEAGSIAKRSHGDSFTTV